MSLLKTGLLSVILLSLTCACTVTQDKTATVGPSPSTLKLRVTTYWQAKIKGDLEQTYHLETPDFRKKTRLLEYLKAQSTGFLIQEARVESITIDGPYAKVNLLIRTHLMGIRTPKGGITRTMVDYWKLVDGQWYHSLPPLPKKRSKPINTGYRLPDKDFGLRYRSESSTTYYGHDLLRFLPLALPKSLSESL